MRGVCWVVALSLYVAKETFILFFVSLAIKINLDNIIDVVISKFCTVALFAVYIMRGFLEKRMGDTTVIKDKLLKYLTMKTGILNFFVERHSHV